MTERTSRVSEGSDLEDLPAPKPVAADLFVDDGVNTLLRTGRCDSCGGYSFPIRAICQNCGPGTTVAEQQIAGKGRIYASTVVRVPSPVGLKPPYGYGYVDLDSAPLRVFALFTGADPSLFVPGANVDMTVEPLYTNERGEPLIAHKFVLANGGKV